MPEADQGCHPVPASAHGPHIEERLPLHIFEFLVHHGAECVHSSVIQALTRSPDDRIFRHNTTLRSKTHHDFHLAGRQLSSGPVSPPRQSPATRRLGTRAAPATPRTRPPTRQPRQSALCCCFVPPTPGLGRPLPVTNRQSLSRGLDCPAPRRAAPYATTPTTPTRCSSFTTWSVA